jgi:hypothetical protein
MRSSRHGLATTILLILGVGCSSHSSESAGDASIEAGQAGKGIDSRSADVEATGIDSGRLIDAPTGVDLAVLDAGVLRDVVSAIDAFVEIDGTSWDVSRGLDGLDVRATTDTRDSASKSNDAFDAPSIHDTNGDVAADSAVFLTGNCANPIVIPNYNSYSVLLAKTTGASHILDFPCASNGADVVFKVQVTQPEIAYADTFGTSWNTALFFSDTCDRPNSPDGTGTDTCSDDACGTSQSQAFAKLDYGWHYLIVSGVNGESGNVTVHFQHAPIGSGELASLPMDQNQVQGTTISGIDTSGLCDSAGPKNSYWWANCPDYAGGDFTATTCNGANWDTVLIMQIPQLGTTSCSDDDTSCGILSTVNATIPSGAGLYVLTVSGSLMSTFGDYTLAYTLP